MAQKIENQRNITHSGVEIGNKAKNTANLLLNEFSHRWTHLVIYIY